MSERSIVRVVFATFERYEPRPAKLQLVYERREAKSSPAFGVRNALTGTTAWFFTYERAHEQYIDRCDELGAPSFRNVAGAS